MNMHASLGVRQGNFDLQETIDRNFWNIEEWFKQCGRSYGDLKKKTIAEILTGDLTDDSMVVESMNYITQRGPDPNLTPIMHSLVYSILAELAYKEGDSARGWSLIAEACHLSGVAQSFALQEQIRLSAIKKKADGRKGPAVRAKNDYEPTKRKVVELLRTEQPEGGWLDSESAARSILELVEKYIQEHRIGLKKSNLLSTLKKWLAEDPFVSLEFNALVSSKA